MPSLNEIFNSLYGAWRLALFDPSGMRHFNLTISGFWRSFTAMFLALAFVLLVKSLQGAPDPGDGGATVGLNPVVGTIAFFVDWIAFPLAMIVVAKFFNLSANYVPYIIAYNWSQLIGQAFVAATSVAIGATFGQGALVLMMIPMGAVLVYAWFVTKTALMVPGGTAFAIVVLSVLLSILINVMALNVGMMEAPGLPQ